jgi:hypothetical protein
LELKDSQRIGRQAEEVVFEFLKRRGYLIVPTALIERGGAPLLEGFVKGHILPNGLASQSGQSGWVEVKYKSRATFNAKYRRWEHGIELHQWDSYLAVVRETGISGSLAIVEGSEILLLGSFNLISVSARRMDDENTREKYKLKVGDGMIYFDRRAFDMFRISEQGLAHISPEPVLPVMVRPWEKCKKPPGSQQGMLPL